jgi:hypothetical protein
VCNRLELQRKASGLAAVSSSGTRSSAPLALRLAPPQYIQDRTPVRGWRDLLCISPVAGRQRVAPRQSRMSKTSDCRRAVGHHKCAYFDTNSENFHLAAPRPRLERGTYCLGGTFEVWPGGAGRGPTCHSAAGSRDPGSAGEQVDRRPPQVKNLLKEVRVLIRRREPCGVGSPADRRGRGLS